MCASMCARMCVCVCAIDRERDRGSLNFLFRDYQVAMVISQSEVDPFLQGRRRGRREDEKEGGETDRNIKRAMNNHGHSSNVAPPQKILLDL